MGSNPFLPGRSAIILESSLGWNALLPDYSLLDLRCPSISDVLMCLKERGYREFSFYTPHIYRQNPIIHVEDVWAINTQENEAKNISLNDCVLVELPEGGARTSLGKMDTMRAITLMKPFLQEEMPHIQLELVIESSFDASLFSMCSLIIIREVEKERGSIVLPSSTLLVISYADSPIDVMVCGRDMGCLKKGELLELRPC